MYAWLNVDDYNMKVHTKEYFQEFVLSEITFMRPRLRKVNTKGAPKKNKHSLWSTKWSPSLWEHVNSLDPDTHASQSHINMIK